MRRTGKRYALLASVGDYHQIGGADLPSWKMDVELIRQGLTQGLAFEEDNIRTIGRDESGFVSGRELAAAMSDFSRRLRAEDTFLFYFSGHGKSRSLILSDMGLALQSVLEVADRMPARSKIVIVDCCYSGDFRTDAPKRLELEESIASFAGRGIAILASTSADSVSRLGPGGNHSLYTGALSAAMQTHRLVRRGRISLQDIHDEICYLMSLWSETHPAQSQEPIFRSSVGGTIWFPVEEAPPRLPQKIYLDTDRYTICSVDSMNSAQMKRLKVFAILKQNNDPPRLSAVTREIVETVRQSEYPAGDEHAGRQRQDESGAVGHPGKTENRSSVRTGKSREDTVRPVRAAWCYYALDRSDIAQHRYAAYTIWAADDEARTLYYRKNRNAHIEDGIWIFENRDYQRLRALQQPTLSMEEFTAETRQLLGCIVNMAEEFIAAVQEIANGTMTPQEVQGQYSSWITKVQRQYQRLTALDSPPDDLVDWMDEVEFLAGNILDMSMILRQTSDAQYTARDQWLMQQAIRRYYNSLERAAALEPDG